MIRRNRFTTAAVPAGYTNESVPRPMAQLDNVTMQSSRKVILDRVSVQMNHGEIVRLVGDSGSGKSSMMRMLIDLEAPQTGSVELMGINLADLSKKQRRQLLSRHAGIVFQEPTLLGNFSGADNIFLPHEQRGIQFDAADRSRVAGLIGAVGLAVDQLRARGSEISGGEAQRISFVSALAHEPDLLFMDEPTSAQDPAGRAAMYDLLRGYIDEAPHRRSALVITHDTIQRGIVNRHVEIAGGRVMTPPWPTDPIV